MLLDNYSSFILYNSVNLESGQQWFLWDQKKLPPGHSGPWMHTESRILFSRSSTPVKKYLVNDNMGLSKEKMWSNKTFHNIIFIIYIHFHNFFVKIGYLLTIFMVLAVCVQHIYLIYLIFCLPNFEINSKFLNECIPIIPIINRKNCLP